MINNKKDNFVYHYCSPEVFLAIIENKAILLFDINKMSDCMEKKWVARYLLQNIDRHLKQNCIPMNLDQEYKYNQKSTTHRAYLVNLMNDFVYDAAPVLVGCFSKNGDSLGQWSAYAAGGAGLSIGFNQSLLEGLETENSLFNPHISYKEIVYDELNQQLILENLIKASVELMAADYENTPLGRSYYSFESYFYDEFDSFCSAFMKGLGFESCFIKNPALQEEAERRIAFKPRPTGGATKGKFIFAPTKNTIQGNKMTTSSEISFAGLIEEGIIGKIILGPKSEITTADLKALFAANGYDSSRVEIYKSAATYR